VKWELEPTLKFLSKLGSVDSFGVDAMLKHLGLTHAKSTVPKWIQRGLMDNLNDLMQKIAKTYIKMLPD
jgi:hypothetical protein